MGVARHAVSVASGTPWLGEFPTQQGVVLVYCGEGGARNVIRRVRAIAEAKEVPFGTLRGTLRVSERAPHLKQDNQLMAVREEALLYEPALITVDPLYLAAIGAKGSDLYAMGETLTGIQDVAQDAGAALLFTHHWNKTGVGGGAQRMTGVGPGAWGRVLGSGDVRSTRRDGDKSIVRVRWEFIGSEIPETAFIANRTVWADDPHDLTSPLHYEVEIVDEDEAPDVDGVKLARRRKAILDWLAAYPRSTTNDLRAVAGCRKTETTPLLDQMVDEGLIRREPGPRGATLWSPVPEDGN